MRTSERDPVVAVPLGTCHVDERRPRPAVPVRTDREHGGGRFRARVMALVTFGPAYGPLVAYDIEAESRRLIADGLPDRPVQLSRRRRFAPVAVDVDGDVAGTWFVRRGVGCFWDEVGVAVWPRDRRLSRGEAAPLAGRGRTIGRRRELAGFRPSYVESQSWGWGCLVSMFT